jgi:two-component system, OmpR family, sensor histidine kinase MtrB
VSETVRAAGASLQRRAAGSTAATRRWLLGLSDVWRRSLQLRVVTATLVLSAVVVSVLGYFLMQRFVTDLYESKLQTASNVVDVGVSLARQSPAFQGKPGGGASADMQGLVGEIYGKPPEVMLQPTYKLGTPFALLVTPPPGLQGPPVYSRGQQAGFAGHVTSPPVPPNLLKLVSDELNTDRPKFTWTSMPYEASSTPVAGLLIGAKFGYGYQIYYFFPLTAEQKTIAAIQRTLLLVGVAAVFLLAAIAWLVTRWVVVPVRQAAQGAWRLSAGHLNERMEVRGTDDLAALATSFNAMAASLQEKLAELEDLSQVQRLFVSDVSHELRTPLTTIRIAADVLLQAKDKMEPAAGRSAELLQSQLERFESLLTDLLEISRYDANAATLEAEPVDIGMIIRQSADVAQQLAERRGARIEFRLPAEACIAEVDRRRLERILRNLLQNAVEHGENKDIVVTAAADSAAVAVSVRDYGVGLRPGEDQLVFDRFWRADPARARSSGGTGLGLAIALEDARLHGGWLEAWGEPGRGCVFRLTLPRFADGVLQGSPLPLSPDEAGVSTSYAVLPELPELESAGHHDGSDHASDQGSGQDEGGSLGSGDSQDDPGHSAESGAESEAGIRG